MIHAGDVSLLDYNRAGTPLLEIVTQPDLEVGEEAEVFLQQLRRLVRWLGVCDGNMEEGSLRCDANVSVNPEGLGARVQGRGEEPQLVEVRAPGHRLRDRAPGGDPRARRNGDPGDPALEREPGPDRGHADQGERARLPLLPRARPAALHRRRRVPRRGRAVPARAARGAGPCASPRATASSDEQARQICEEREVADYFERTLALGADAQAAATWLAADVQQAPEPHRPRLSRTRPLTAARFAELLRLLAERRIHGKIAKSVLEAVFAEDKDPAAIIREKGWEQIVDAAVAARARRRHGDGRHADTVAAIRAGRSPAHRVPHRRDHARDLRPGRARPRCSRS